MKRCKKLFFVIMCALCTFCANSAQIVNFGATLCPTGTHAIGSTCHEFTVGNCPSGYYEYSCDSASFSSVPQDGICRGVYDNVDLSQDDYVFIYTNGILVNFGATLCPSGQMSISGKCTSIPESKCDSGYYGLQTDGSTFSAKDADDLCRNMYDEVEISDNVYLIYTGGILVNFGPTEFCLAGTSWVDGECVAYTKGDCPDNMYEITLDSDVFARHQNGVCESGYTDFPITASCGAGQLQYNMCAIMCESGTTYTNVGTCAEPCSWGRYYHVGDDLTLPLYATRETSPSLNFQHPSGTICYVNMLPGRQAGALTTSIDGQIYHMTD